MSQCARDACRTTRYGAVRVMASRFRSGVQTLVREAAKLPDAPCKGHGMVADLVRVEGGVPASLSLYPEDASLHRSITWQQGDGAVSSQREWHGVELNAGKVPDRIEPARPGPVNEGEEPASAFVNQDVGGVDIAVAERDRIGRLHDRGKSSSRARRQAASAASSAPARGAPRPTGVGRDQAPGETTAADAEIHPDRSGHGRWPAAAPFPPTPPGPLGRMQRSPA